jgi:hypothetical protein
MFTCAHAVLPTNAQASANRASSKPQQHVSTVTLPLVHAEVTPEDLAYLGALGVLAALELIEWPMVAVLVAGNVVVTSAHRQVVREIAAGVGEAV